MLRMEVQLSSLLIIPRCWLCPTAALRSTEDEILEHPCHPGLTGNRRRGIETLLMSVS